MRLFRVFAWDARAAPPERGGALSFPRAHAGGGRHDNPALYGCLDVSERPLAAVVEQLARFRGRALSEDTLSLAGLPVALAVLTLPDEALLIDLDDPAVLEREGLRPSAAATRDRAITQAAAAALFGRHAEAVGLRWCSVFEPAWANVTLYDRARKLLAVEEVRPLGLGDEVVAEAAVFLGLPST
ncbi:MAG TPA: RES family NAD+ phosphorylase [Gaiellaceae bacterium]|nr:RES family NAD+ phosphorylase [Gaiellaceae bacterium]